MNPNLDFREGGYWDDRKLEDGSVGDCFLILADFAGYCCLFAFLIMCVCW